MARFEDLENAGLRIKYDDAGLPSDVIDSRGNSFGFALLKKNLTGMLEIFAGTDGVITFGTNAPNDADGKPAGSIYFQI